MLKLSDRMNRILDMCESFDVWADIGCDHGIISAELVLRSKAKKVIASDISEASLFKAQGYALSMGISDKVVCRLGNGFGVLAPKEADGAILSGMGTPLIITIISQNRSVSENLKSMVISANNYPDRLRKWLTNNGYHIQEEQIVKDAGRFYPIMKAKKGDCIPYSEKELLLGRNILVDDSFKQYVDWLILRENNIISQMGLGGNDPLKHVKMKEIFEEVKNDRC